MSDISVVFLVKQGCKENTILQIVQISNVNKT